MHIITAMSADQALDAQYEGHLSNLALEGLPAMQSGSAQPSHAPLLVQNCMPRLKAVPAWDVGPPWILISRGAFSPSWSLKALLVGG